MSATKAPWWKFVWNTRESNCSGEGVRKDGRERMFEMNIKHGMGIC